MSISVCSQVHKIYFRNMYAFYEEILLFMLYLFLFINITTSESSNMEGEICTTNGDLCKKLKDCDYYNYDDIRKGTFKPPFCGFVGSEPIVCCTKQFNNMFGFSRKTKSAQMCEKYEYQICNNSNNRTRKDYLTDEDVTPPFMALIGFGSSNNITWKCSGSIISTRYILSAAQCSNDKDLGQAKWVQIGDLERKSESQRLSITTYFNHPDSKNESLYNDVTLFRLNKEITFTDSKRPICLHQYTSILTHNSVYVMGQGKDYLDGLKKSNLLRVELNLLPHRECNISSFRSKLTEGFNKKNMICAGEIQEDEGDCPADVGGPVYLSNSKGKFGNTCYLYTQVGLTSFPYQCGEEKHVGIYTNIGNYIHWIESVVWSDENSSDSSFSVWV